MWVWMDERDKERHGERATQRDREQFVSPCRSLIRYLGLHSVVVMIETSSWQTLCNSSMKQALHQPKVV